MSGRLRTSAVLAGASLAAGVLAYVLFALLTRHLGPADAAPVSILWTYWGLSAAAVTFPVQHWLAQSVAAHGGFGAARHALPGLAGVLVGASVVTGLVAWMLRETLFHRADAAFPALVALMTAGAFVMGVSRGLLTARRRFTALGASLLGEQVARVVPTAALATAGVQDEAWFGLVIVAASFVTLLWPPALRMPRSERSTAPASVRALGAAASAQLLGQLVLTGGPVLLAIQGGAPRAVTALFTALAVFRAPFILAQSQVAPLTGRWTVLVSEGRNDTLTRIRLALVLGAGPGALVAAAVGALLGDPVVRLVFGPGLELGPTVTALVSAGSTVAVANLATTVLAIAHARPHVPLLAWAVGGAVGLAAVALPWSPELRTATAFVIAEATAFAVMLLILRRGVQDIAKSVA